MKVKTKVMAMKPLIFRERPSPAPIVIVAPHQALPTEDMLSDIADRDG